MTTSSTSPVALVTGANTGIGYVTARELLRAGHQVFYTCRDADKARQTGERLRAETGRDAEALLLDLSDFGSIRACAADFLGRNLPLPLLVNNAGLAGKRGMTRSGFEMTFGTNHVGTFLFTSLLLDAIKRSAPARIVTVASKAHYKARGIDWSVLKKPTATITGVREYEVSKLANVLFSAELGRRLAGSGVNTYSLHPGVVATDVWRQVPWPVRPLITRMMITPEEGARTTLYCSTAAACAGETGLYYDEERVKEPSAVAQDASLAAELWRRSEEWVRA